MRKKSLALKSGASEWRLFKLGFAHLRAALRLCHCGDPFCSIGWGTCCNRANFLSRSLFV